VQGRFPDGVCFVDLTPLRDPDRLPDAITHALGLQETSGRTPLAGLIEELREKELLLVLDNFEQLLPAATVLLELLATGPRLKFLVTSRACLRVRGEQELPVPPLPVPPAGPRPGANPDPALTEEVQRLAAVPSVAMFVERARAVRPEFALTAENARAVAAICRRLDGLPLAIELAAARVRLFSPAALLERLGSGTGEERIRSDGRPPGSPLRVLVDGARDLPPRQQTLRDAIGWSYGLLSAEEQSLFRHLSVFAGGFTPEAAEAVGGSGVERLASLLEQNLLQRDEETGAEARFRMLETVREFGLEQLIAHGEVAAARRRHAGFYLELAEQGERQLKVASSGEWLRRLDREQDNFRAALAWSLESESTPCEPDPAEVGLQLASALAFFWSMRSYMTEGREWLSRLLATPAAAGVTSLRARALFWSADLSWQMEDRPPAQSLCQEALAIYRELGDHMGAAQALDRLGYWAAILDRHDEARRYLEECLALWREIGDPEGLARAFNSLGGLLYRRGEMDHARAAYEEALTICERHGLRGQTIGTLANLRLIAAYCEELEVAERYAVACLATARELEIQPRVAGALHELGLLAYRLGDLARSRRILEEALAAESDQELRPLRVAIHGSLGRVMRMCGEYTRSGRLLEEGLEAARRLSSDRLLGPWLHAIIQQHLAELSLTLGDCEGAASRYQAALSHWQEFNWSPYLPRWGPKPGIASCLDGVAVIVGRRGQPDVAARLLGATEALRRSIGLPLPPPEAAEREGHVAEVRAALTSDVFAAAWEEGSALSWEQAITEGTRAIQSTSDTSD
jgi:predicted ATPase